MPVDRAKLELVEVGTPVAVKTPVGIVVVLEVLPFDVEVVTVVGGGALIITLVGGAVGLPATLVTLPSGVFQLAEALYKTPLKITPA